METTVTIKRRKRREKREKDRNGSNRLGRNCEAILVRGGSIEKGRNKEIKDNGKGSEKETTRNTNIKKETKARPQKYTLVESQTGLQRGRRHSKYK